MKILKFGGTSVGSAENIRKVMQIVCDDQPKVVVLSAMSGSTNALIQIIEARYKNRIKEALSLGQNLREKYGKEIKSLFSEEEQQKRAVKGIDGIWEVIWEQLNTTEFSRKGEQLIVAQGELISTYLFHLLLQQENQPAKLVPALDFMKYDKNRQIDRERIKAGLSDVIAANPKVKYFITQGFICRNERGEIDNLGRGGSDYTASLIGAALDVEEVEIWTDISGMRNNDPRVVEETKKVEYLSFQEAAELAYFGAKILHPLTVQPCREKRISVRLKNTMEPKDEGTLISEKVVTGAPKAIAAKDHITVIKILSAHMLMVYGFLTKVFSTFERYETPVDMITTSEVGISLTIDDESKLEEIEKDLSQFARIKVDKDMTIICIVGDMKTKRKDFEKNIFSALEGIPIRMIAYGGSDFNLSLVVRSEDKQEALLRLNNCCHCDNENK